jgi:radical SAM protein with 4Fe4S-binding SPASM domain
MPHFQEDKDLNRQYTSSRSLPSLGLWDKMVKEKMPLSFDLEVTARCNNNCQHCYINLPAKDSQAKDSELSLEEIKRIAGEAVSMGAVWCLITGGEPLLRGDFQEIYIALKRMGLLVSVFTNACLVTKKDVELFKRYPPRDIEVTVYGSTQETYERITRKPGSFADFQRGLDLMLQAGVKVRLKTMTLRSNVHELADIARFCREHTKDYFRFDPLLHLRYDGDADRNKEILAERLSPEDIAAIEYADKERFNTLQKHCDKFIFFDSAHMTCNHMFHCATGIGNFCVSYNGLFRLCSSLWHPGCIYDLRKGTLREAWQNLVPAVRQMRSNNEEFLCKCRKCPIINLCLWCPAHAYLEVGKMDSWVDYFCKIAHERAKNLGREYFLNSEEMEQNYLISSCNEPIQSTRLRDHHKNANF